MYMKSDSAADRGAVPAGHGRRGVRAADDRHDRRTRARRAESRGPGRDRHGEEREHRLLAAPKSATAKASTGSPACRSAATRCRSSCRGFQAQKRTRPGQRVRDRRRRTSTCGSRSVSESVTVTAEIAAGRHDLVRRRRRRRHAARREPAAERPAVRQPGGDDSRRRPRLPRRPDQEHAVLAADQRRQRPQRELPDRRRRQQRRHRRRPAAALPARGDPGVQLPDARATRRSTAAATAAS